MEDVSKMQMHSSLLEKEQIALINQVEWRAQATLTLFSIDRIASMLIEETVMFHDV